MMGDIADLKQCGNTFTDLPSDCLGPWFALIESQGNKVNKALLKACMHPAASQLAANRPCYGEGHVVDGGTIDNDDEPLANLIQPAPIVPTVARNDCGHVLPSSHACGSLACKKDAYEQKCRRRLLCCARARVPHQANHTCSSC